jgi:hypothetical protein
MYCVGGIERDWELYKVGIKGSGIDKEAAAGPDACGGWLGGARAHPVLPDCGSGEGHTRCPASAGTTAAVGAGVGPHKCYVLIPNSVIRMHV